ncbi:MAG: nicotinate-nucleotide--dimethylbenzimidazole phosphoribosyltransferase [Pseudobutyrivibrio sp.]|nr:nicotinate-nucleotide--dimethylbenzimidazole phosphoribosyltransferase [Pseudobutyrivibrio sp.]
MKYLFEDILENKIKIDPVSEELFNKIKENWDHVSKPINGFGTFESIYAKIGAIQGQKTPSLEKIRLIECCGDHGIVEEGVSQADQSVTRICAETIGKGLTTSGVMAKAQNIDVVAVDVGINYDGQIPGTVYKRVKNGTNNFLKESAMTVMEFTQAVQVGMDLIKESKDMGYDLILMGEMGIGNTTSASVMAGYLLELNAETVTGRGAGLTDEGLSKKRAVVSMALSMYRDLSPLEVCVHFGGLELAAMTGLVLGGALYHIPVVLDGMLSMISALVADRLLEGAADYLIPSHKSKEIVTEKLAKKLRVSPVLDAEMALGEGTGAVMMVSLLRAIEVAYTKALKFGDSGVEQYENYGNNQ